MASIGEDMGVYILQHTPWNKLPPSLKERLGNSTSAYERAIVDYSKANQLPWRTSMVRQIIKNERKYYEDILQYCRTNLMLYPYHLQDQFVQGLKVTPFEYYRSILELIMVEQRSYDSLPNFTARDCYRLIGIGRNEYIDIMNKYRSKRFWRKRSPNEFLPESPQYDINIQPWWYINVGYITEEEIEKCTSEERKLIDSIINNGACVLGTCNKTLVQNLYNRQLIYCVIVIEDMDYIVIPPLKGFVMNRVSGDYFETLLYKVFVTITEHTHVAELATVLQIDLQQVKNAVSVFIRLGFAHKKALPDTSMYDKSWLLSEERGSPSGGGDSISLTSTSPLMELHHSTTNIDTELLMMEQLPPTTPHKDIDITPSVVSSTSSTSGTFQKRIGFLFDSTLTAFLMMGNLSPGLKNHAVTMFEVGKLTDEGLDDFLSELNKVGQEPEGEGEAQRYFQHAVILRNTIQFLRHNRQLMPDGIGIDLLHCESMNKLDIGTLNRLLEKNYRVLVSMAPLSQEVHSVSCCVPPHIGPALPEMNAIWFKLWLYHKLHSGPPSLLLIRGTRLRTLPAPFKSYKKLLLTSWGHDTAVVNSSNVLLTINEALTHSAVLLQAHGWKDTGTVKHVPFPFNKDTNGVHNSLVLLDDIVDLRHSCGYVTMLRTGCPVGTNGSKERDNGKQESVRKMEISEFLEDLKELGIGGEGDNTTSPLPATTNSTSNAINSNTEDSPIGGIVSGDSEWVPLELCFGIPLFDMEANEAVCTKIVSNNLFMESSLQELIHSNRLLALDVMDFISNFQGNSGSYGHLSSSSIYTSLSVPLPTQCLIFTDNILTTFRN